MVNSLVSCGCDTITKRIVLHEGIGTANEPNKCGATADFNQALQSVMTKLYQDKNKEVLRELKTVFIQFFCNYICCVHVQEIGRRYKPKPVKAPVKAPIIVDTPDEPVKSAKTKPIPKPKPVFKVNGGAIPEYKTIPVEVTLFNAQYAHMQFSVSAESGSDVNNSSGVLDNLVRVCYFMTMVQLEAYTEHHKACLNNNEKSVSGKYAGKLSDPVKIYSAKFPNPGLFKHIKHVLDSFYTNSAQCQRTQDSECKSVEADNQIVDDIIANEIFQPLIYQDDMELLLKKGKKTSLRLVDRPGPTTPEWNAGDDQITAFNLINLITNLLACTYRVIEMRERAVPNKLLSSAPNAFWSYAYVNMYREYLLRINNDGGYRKLISPYLPYIGVYMALFNHLSTLWTYYDETLNTAELIDTRGDNNLFHLNLPRCFDLDIRVLVDQYIYNQHKVGDGYKGGSFYCVINDFTGYAKQCWDDRNRLSQVDVTDLQPGTFQGDVVCVGPLYTYKYRDKNDKSAPTQDLLPGEALGDIPVIGDHKRIFKWSYEHEHEERPKGVFPNAWNITDLNARHPHNIQNYSPEEIIKHGFYREPVAATTSSTGGHSLYEVTEETATHTAINTFCRLNPFVAEQAMQTLPPDPKPKLDMARGLITKTLTVFHGPRYTYNTSIDLVEPELIIQKAKSAPKESNYRFDAVLNMQYHDQNCMTSMMNISNLLRLNINVRVYTFGGSGVGKTSFLFGRAEEPNLGSIINVVMKTIMQDSSISYICHEVYGAHSVPILMGSKESQDIDLLRYYVHRLDGTSQLADLDYSDPEFPQSPFYDDATLTTPQNNGARIPASGTTKPNMLYDYKHFTTNPHRDTKEKTDLFSKAYKTSEVSLLCADLQLLDNLVTGQRKLRNGRIRPTANNPSSSRSILVYTFRVTNTLDKNDRSKDVTTYLQVVDMMGYEDFRKPQINETLVQKTAREKKEAGEITCVSNPPVVIVPPKKKPKVIDGTAMDTLLTEGNFIRYSLALAAEHTKRSAVMNNALFNFPYTPNTTLKNIGIYIINNTGANKSKMELLFQSARFGSPKVKKVHLKHDELTQITLSLPNGSGNAAPFKMQYPGQDTKPLTSNSKRLQELIARLEINDPGRKGYRSNTFMSAIALLAVVKNRQIQRYFDMQKDQINFLNTLDIAA
jgi:hypothetical protein